MVNLLPSFDELFNSKTKAKPSGLPDSNFIFFVATKKTKQKKASRCAGHVWLVRAATSIQLGLSDKVSAYPTQDPRLLRASPFVEDCIVSQVFRLFPSKSHQKEGPPVTGRLIKLRPIRLLRNLVKEMPSARR